MPLTIHWNHGSPSNKKHFSPARPLISERVYQELKKDIITGILEPGRPLTEAFLIRKLGASLTPVREACIRLNSERLLESVPNRGYSVASISVNRIHELFTLRLLLEEFTVQEACKQDNPELMKEIESLGRIVASFGKRESYLNYIDANTKLHLSIAHLAGNESVVEILGNVLNQLARLSYLTVATKDDAPQVGRQHAEIIEAIRKKDSKGAKKCIRKDIQNAKQKVLSVYFK